jgi:hypothetical protein
MPKGNNQPLTLKHFQAFEKTLDKRFDGVRREVKDDLNEGLAGLQREFKNDNDDLRKEVQSDLGRGLEGLAAIFSKEVKRLDGRIDRLERKFDQKFDKLISTLDEYIKKVEAWHEDSRVLAARLERVQRILIEKGIATEKELSL